jgi:hypothetical protein
MSDLTEHLRGYADPAYRQVLLGKGSLDNTISDLLEDAVLAAARIEALEAALREITYFPVTNKNRLGTLMLKIARAALAPEQDK